MFLFLWCSVHIKYRSLYLHCVLILWIHEPALNTNLFFLFSILTDPRILTDMNKRYLFLTAVATPLQIPYYLKKKRSPILRECKTCDNINAIHCKIACLLVFIFFLFTWFSNFLSEHGLDLHGSAPQTVQNVPHESVVNLSTPLIKISCDPCFENLLFIVCKKEKSINILTSSSYQEQIKYRLRQNSVEI